MKSRHQETRNVRFRSILFICASFLKYFIHCLMVQNLERSTKSQSNNNFLSSAIRCAQSTNFTYKDHDMVISEIIENSQAKEAIQCL